MKLSYISTNRRKNGYEIYNSFFTLTGVLRGNVTPRFRNESICYHDRIQETIINNAVKLSLLLQRTVCLVPWLNSSNTTNIQFIISVPRSHSIQPNRNCL